MVEAADEGDLLQNVGLDARNAVEEEDGEDAGGGTEGGADGAPVWVCVRNGGFLPGDFKKSLSGLHPEESAGGVLAELELGDLVAGGRFGSASRAWIRYWAQLMGHLFSRAHT